MASTAIFDVDGTLVDTNYQHALAWYLAFREHDIVLPLWKLHQHIGMGGDQYVTAVAGEDVEERLGDALRDGWVEQFDQMIDEVEVLEGARALLVAVKERGLDLILASSGKPKHVEHFLDLLDARSLADGWTTSDDVEKTKPAPDLVKVALELANGGKAVMVGDSPWDCKAAAKLDVPTIALRTGGFPVADLREAGAVAVYDSLPELERDLGNSALGGPDPGTR